MKTTMRRKNTQHAYLLEKKNKQKNTEENYDEDYYEKKTHTTCPPT